MQSRARGLPHRASLSQHLALAVCTMPPRPVQRFIRDLDVDVAGFTELNGWEDDTQTSKKARVDSTSVSWLSGQAGLPFAQFLFVPPGYHIGEGEGCVCVGRKPSWTVFTPPPHTHTQAHQPHPHPVLIYIPTCCLVRFVPLPRHYVLASHRGPCEGHDAL